MNKTKQKTPDVEDVFHKKTIKQRLIDATHSKYGMWVLGFISFIESAFFPIPPDFFIVPIVAAKPDSWKRIAWIVSITSILGSFLGYFIGAVLFEAVGEAIVQTYNLEEKMNELGEIYNQNAFWSLLIAAFTPLPYKVFTIAAGVFKVDILAFALASIIGRGARYILVPYMASVGGKKAFWDYLKRLKRITWIAIVAVLIAVLAIVLS